MCLSTLVLPFADAAWTYVDLYDKRKVVSQRQVLISEVSVAAEIN